MDQQANTTIAIRAHGPFPAVKPPREHKPPLVL
jgi:hypothetical protein